jgi:hypothetical protein
VKSEEGGIRGRGWNDARETSETVRITSLRTLRLPLLTRGLAGDSSRGSYYYLAGD